MTLTEERTSAPADVETTTWQRLWRYTAGSVVSFGVAELAFVVLFGAGLLGATAASVVSSVLGVVPGYFLNRQWTWGRRGRSSVRREVAPYWVTAVVSTALAAVVTGSVNHAVASHPHDQRTVINAVAYMGTYGVLFVAKFLLFQRLFSRRAA